MKKISLLLIGVILSAIPVHAENWLQLDTGLFVDADSFAKYYLPNFDNIYSISLKAYNDGSNNFYKNEDYMSALVLFNCKNGQKAIKSGKVYYKDGHTGLDANIINKDLKWVNVNPLSRDELVYNYVCQPSIKKASTEANKINSNTSIASDIYKQKVKSMLYIEAPNSDSVSQGSGVILNSDGTFVTCFHVIAKADYIKVRTTNGEEYYVDGFKYINPLDDIAILTLNTNNTNFVPISLPYNNSQIGEKVYTISNPRGFEFSFSDGMISQFTKENIQFTAPSSPGSSGGALLNNKGELLGIISWQRTDGQNINFATPNNYYVSKIYNTPVKNLKNEKWSEFVLNNAGEEQYKLTLQYAIKWSDYPLLYQYIKPYVNKNDYPQDMLALAAFIAYNAYIIKGDKFIEQDTINWYEKALQFNPSSELALFSLAYLYSINGYSKEKIASVLAKLSLYPESYNTLFLISNCNPNDETCYSNVIKKVNERMFYLTGKTYWNSK